VWFVAAAMGLVEELKTKEKGKRKIFGGERSLDRQKRRKGILSGDRGECLTVGHSTANSVQRQN